MHAARPNRPNLCREGHESRFNSRVVGKAQADANVPVLLQLVEVAAVYRIRATRSPQHVNRRVYGFFQPEAEVVIDGPSVAESRKVRGMALVAQRGIVWNISYS